jgi:hypothetical protein
LRKIRERRMPLFSPIGCPHAATWGVFGGSSRGHRRFDFAAARGILAAMWEDRANGG